MLLIRDCHYIFNHGMAHMLGIRGHMRTVLINILAIMSTATSATSMPYRGVWASSHRACKADPNLTEDAAFVIESKVVYGNEWQCKIKSINSNGNWLQARLKCASEGTEFSRQVKWRVISDRLQQVERGHAANLVRCSKSDYRGMPRG